MKLEPVKSSGVEAVGYDAANKALHVKFKSGGTYAYQNVAPHHAPAIMKAQSVGKYLHQHIYDHHAGTKVI